MGYKSFVLLALLAACSVSVNNNSVIAAQKWCEPHGGLRAVAGADDSSPQLVIAYCNDGVVVKAYVK